MNLFTIIYQGEMYHISAKQFRAYICIAATILISIIIAIALLSAHQNRQQMVAEINQAIKGNKYVKVEDFEFFKSLQNKTYITTNNYREVSDISVSNTSHPSDMSNLSYVGTRCA